MSVQYHEDDRGQRLLDIFPEVDGQINIIIQSVLSIDSVSLPGIN